MTSEMWIIAVVRVAGSLPVLRWPFAGAILAMLVDLSDLFLRELIHLGGVRDYQSFDKYLDQVYMLTFLAVAVRWQPVPRNIAVGLYALRMLGFVAYEATGERAVLLAFPNVFEFWFVFVAGLKFFGLEEDERRKPVLSRAEGEGAAWRWRFAYAPRQLTVVLPLLLAAKEFQEYALHGARWLDSFTATEAVESVWDWLTGPFR